MEDPIIEENYEEAKRQAKELYSKIGRVWCPALNDYVIFSRRGFQHLVQKGSAFRPKSEQRRRFILIADAKKILTDRYSSFSCDIKENDHSGARLWIFTVKKDGLIIKVIVRQIDSGKKHFLSVYARKQKSAS